MRKTVQIMKICHIFKLKLHKQLSLVFNKFKENAHLKIAEMKSS